MSNIFIGREFKGISDLKKNLDDKLYKKRDMKLDNVIDEIANRTRDLDIIQFDDSPNIYIGTFITTDKQSEKLIKASKDYKKAVELIQRDFVRIPTKYEDIIMIKSIDMK